MKTPRTPIHLSAAFAAVFLFGLLPGLPAAAFDLPCELTIPSQMHWTDYFSAVGAQVSLGDDECGMQAPGAPAVANLGDASVRLDLPYPPHWIRYEMLIASSRLAAKPPARVLVFDMIREEQGSQTPVLELWLTAESTLELVIYGDNETIPLDAGAVNPAGFYVAVELEKSRTSETNDGTVRLLLDLLDSGQPPAVLEQTGLMLWTNLPNAIRLGVVKVESAESLGMLDFQPLGFSHSFFAP